MSWTKKETAEDRKFKISTERGKLYSFKEFQYFFLFWSRIKQKTEHKYIYIHMEQKEIGNKEDKNKID